MKNAIDPTAVSAAVKQVQQLRESIAAQLSAFRQERDACETQVQALYRQPLTAEELKQEALDAFDRGCSEFARSGALRQVIEAVARPRFRPPLAGPVQLDGVYMREMGTKERASANLQDLDANCIRVDLTTLAMGAPATPGSVNALAFLLRDQIRAALASAFDEHCPTLNPPQGVPRGEPLSIAERREHIAALQARIAALDEAIAGHQSQLEQLPK